MNKIYYICGNCFVPEIHDEEDGMCGNCGADKWIEPRDFEENTDWVMKLHNYDGNAMKFTRNIFRNWIVVSKGRDSILCRDIISGSMHSYPLSNYYKGRQK